MQAFSIWHWLLFLIPFALVAGVIWLVVKATKAAGRKIAASKNNRLP